MIKKNYYEEEMNFNILNFMDVKKLMILAISQIKFIMIK